MKQVVYYDILIGEKEPLGAEYYENNDPMPKPIKKLDIDIKRYEFVECRIGQEKGIDIIYIGLKEII